MAQCPNESYNQDGRGRRVRGVSGAEFSPPTDEIGITWSHPVSRCPEPVDDGILSCCRTPCTLSSSLQPRRFYTPVIVSGETALGLANNRLFTLGKFSRHVHTATWQLQAKLRICPHTSKPSFLTCVDGFVDTPARILRTELDF